MPLRKVVPKFFCFLHHFHHISECHSNIFGRVKRCILNDMRRLRLVTHFRCIVRFINVFTYLCMNQYIIRDWSVSCRSSSLCAIRYLASVAYSTDVSARLDNGWNYFSSSFSLSGCGSSCFLQSWHSLGTIPPSWEWEPKRMTNIFGDYPRGAIAPTASRWVRQCLHHSVPSRCVPFSVVR